MMMLVRKGLLPVVLLLVALGVAPPSHAAEKVVEVKVAGNRKIDRDMILSAVKTRAGDEVQEEKVDADVRAVFALGYFRDVSASTESTPAGTVLTYTVVERPVVREVRIEGNKEINADKIRDNLEIKPNSIYSPKEVARSIRKVKKQYADEGYYQAEVKGEPQKVSESEINFVFTISEGDKILIRNIRLEGNSAFSDRRIKKVMETGEKWFLSWLTGAGTYKEDELRNDVARITELYMNNGYVNAKVGEPRVEILPDKSGIDVTIAVTEGDRYLFGAVDVKGDLLGPKEDLLKKVKIRQGETFNRSFLRDDIAALSDVYADQGYAFANVSPLTRVNQESRSIDITFDVEKGEKVRIERINISGNPRTRDKVIRREMKVAEGEMFSSSAIRRSKQALMNLGFFEDVTIATAPGSGADRLVLNVEVKEKPTGTFSIGGGYSSLDGFVGQGSVQQANFLGLGLKASAAASVGAKSSTYNLGLTDPWFLDTRWTLGADIYRTEREFSNFTRRLTGGDIKAGYPLSDNVSTMFVYRFDKKKIFHIVGSAQDLIPDSTTSSLEMSITRNTTDYRPDPTRGMVNTLSVEFAGIGGTNRFARYIADTTVFFPMFWSTVLGVHGVAGYVQEVGKPVPRDEKFLLGGIGTIRGYGNRTISPLVQYLEPPAEPGGRPVYRYDYLGGDKEAILNVEYVFPLIKDAGLKGVAFFDAGGSFGTSIRPPALPNQVFSDGSLRAAYGFGIRWSSPMGPLRLEYGIPINPRRGIDSGGGRLDFSIGNFF